MKTDEELKALELGLRAGAIFSSAHIPPEQLLQVFLPLALLSPQAQHDLNAAGITFCYEYLDRALPLSVNGLPTFSSVQLLPKADHERLIAIHKKIEAALAVI